MVGWARGWQSVWLQARITEWIYIHLHFISSLLIYTHRLTQSTKQRPSTHSKHLKIGRWSFSVTNTLNTACMWRQTYTTIHHQEHPPTATFLLPFHSPDLQGVKCIGRRWTNVAELWPGTFQYQMDPALLQSVGLRPVHCTPCPFLSRPLTN